MTNSRTTIGAKVITRTVCYGGRVVYSAHEPSNSNSGHFYGHHMIQHFDGLEGAYGEIGTRDLPPHIEALRGGSPERIAACDAYRVEQCAEAHALIRSVYPEAERAVPAIGLPFELEIEPTTTKR